MIPTAPQTEERAPNRAANDNQPANPTIVDLPAPSAEQVDRVLDTLADVLAIDDIEPPSAHELLDRHRRVVLDAPPTE